MTMLADDATLLALLDELEARERYDVPFLDSLPATMVRYRHVDEIGAVLERVARGEIKRLMVFAPPRLGKSTLVAREFAAWLLRRQSTWRVLLASYAARLAQAHSRAAQAAYVRRGGVLAEGQAEKNDWETSSGGGMLAVGIGSGVTGRGGDVLILDDSVADAAEAASEAIAQRNRDWYESTWTTRAEGADIQIVITTRWPGRADLSTYALEMETTSPEGWYIIALDAERDPTPWGFPATCTVHPDWRATGELLCPQRVPREKLAKAKARSGFFYNALYQQRPKARDGVLFKWNDWVLVDAAPLPQDLVAIVRYWDMAGTDVRGDNDPDATSGVLMARHRDGSFWTLHRATKTASVGARDAFIRQTADADRQRWGARVTQWIETQAGIGGHDAMQALFRTLAGHRVKTEPATGDKILRAEPHAAQVEAGNMRLLVGDWTDAYRLQLTGFPFASHDDDVDASSGAFAKCADTGDTVSVSSFSMG
jgi:predicted phage terminase large subunit-like protein